MRSHQGPKRPQALAGGWTALLPARADWQMLGARLRGVAVASPSWECTAPNVEGQGHCRLSSRGGFSTCEILFYFT
jgi:hypothetical protein